MQSKRIDAVRALFAGALPLRGLIEYGLTRVPLAADPGGRWAILEAGDFILCGGEPGLSAADFRAMLEDRHGSLLYAPGAWRQLAEVSGLAFTPAARWAYDHHAQPDDGHLRRLLAARSDVSVTPINGALIPWCREQKWTRDFVSQFTDDGYEQTGLGVLIRVEGSFAAGAGSYVAYPGGIEVQVETSPGHEGRGLATLAAAALILRGHERGLRVTWDAANAASARIADKLGYTPAGIYTILEIK